MQGVLDMILNYAVSRQGKCCAKECLKISFKGSFKDLQSFIFAEVGDSAVAHTIDFPSVIQKVCQPLAKTQTQKK